MITKIDCFDKNILKTSEALKVKFNLKIDTNKEGNEKTIQHLPLIIKVLIIEVDSFVLNCVSILSIEDKKNIYDDLSGKKTRLHTYKNETIVDILNNFWSAPEEFSEEVIKIDIRDVIDKKIELFKL